jgi:hypothetical protein
MPSKTSGMVMFVPPGMMEMMTRYRVKEIAAACNALQDLNALSFSRHSFLLGVIGRQD